MVPWRRSRGRGTWQLRPPASPLSSGRVWESSVDAGDAGDATSAGDAGGDAASWGRTWWQTSPSSPLTQAHTLMLGTGDTAPTAASTCNTTRSGAPLAGVCCHGVNEILRGFSEQEHLKIGTLTTKIFVDGWI